MTDPVIIDQIAGISTIDTGFGRPGQVASHLMVEGDRAALIDVGVAASAPLILAALARKGIALEQVDYVMVTHVHLDHAGAAGTLMAALPNARLVVHPRGARHMIDPAKLIAGATAVYGEEEMAARFGQLLPVPAERVVEAPDGLRLWLNGRELLFLDTPGHARHHYSIYDARSHGIFPGDTFGLSYRDFDTEQGAFVCPTTTPVQFDPQALHTSIERLLELRPQRMFLTHFGCVTEPERLAVQLHAHIDAHVEMARAAAGAGDQRHRRLLFALREWLLQALRRHGCCLDRARVLQLMDMDLELNAQGLEVWLDRS